MASSPAGPDLLNPFHTLSHLGVVGDLPDGLLLDRFLTASDGIDQAAFSALAERHGPMVLRVCMQILGDPHDAQDAFQATFLVLARKAGSVRKADSVASWLHGVALRVAARARSAEIRRRASERKAAPTNVAAPPEPDSWPELHAEIARLPRHYREPVVLCYLEGLSTEAVALRLGCPRGTILSRLSRARDRLRVRLSRHGLAPAAVLASGPPPIVPASLSALTVRLACGLPTAAMVSTSVLTLTEGVLQAMTLSKLKTAALALGLASLLGTAGAGVYAFQGRETTATPSPESGSAPTSPPSSLPVRGKIEGLTLRHSDTPAAPELAAELDLARRKFQRLRGTGGIPFETKDAAEGQVLILEGRISGRIQDLEDELELLEVRLLVKKAELKRASARVESATVTLALNRKLKERNIVGQGDLTKSEAEFQQEEAGRDVCAAEVKEVEVRIRHVQRRLLSLAPLLKNADRPGEVHPKPAPPPSIPGPQ